MKKLNPTQVSAAMKTLPQWTRKRSVIARTYAFADFLAAMRFVNRVAVLAEKRCHHPDIDIRWNRVTLGFTTHDAGGLTSLDFELAAACDALARRRVAATSGSS